MKTKGLYRKYLPPPLKHYIFQRGILNYIGNIYYWGGIFLRLGKGLIARNLGRGTHIASVQVNGSFEHVAAHGQKHLFATYGPSKVLRHLGLTQI